MNRHQVLTGAANNLNHSVSVGSVENNHFTAYGSGYNIVILSSNFDRVQIISGQNFSTSILRCIECTLDTGKIAAVYGSKVFIYEPTPSIKKTALHNIHYKWIQVGFIEINSDIVCISWNNDGTRLLVGCSLGTIQIWSYDSNTIIPNEETVIPNVTKPTTTSANRPVKFSICPEEEDDPTTSNAVHFSVNASSTQQKTKDNLDSIKSNPIFKKVWEKQLANAVKCLKFSPDGSLFASFGENDRLVKVWHEIKPFGQLINSNDELSSKESSCVEYNCVYLAHPRAITSISWRQISKFMPRGMISNSLITCSKDNICRIWSETVVPDDGLLHSSQNEATYVSLAKSARHKRKLLIKLHKMRISSHFPHLSHISHGKSKDGNLNGNHTKDPLSNNNNNNHCTSTLNPTLNNNNNHHSHNIHHNFSSHLLSFTSNLTHPFSNFLAHNNNSSHNVNNSVSSHPHHNHHNHHHPTNDSNTKIMQHNSFSCHELNLKHNHYHSTSNSHISTGFHFHLAGFIDPDAGIPLNLLPNHTTTTSAIQSNETNFIVHWMNNKDFNFTYAAELFFS
jgi:WD40 repeat protein